MILAAFLLVGASLLASGILFQHRRVTTYLAAAGAVLEGQWLLVTLLDRTLLVSTTSSTVFTVGAGVVLAGWLVFYRRWRRPEAVLVREVSVLLLLGVTLGSALLIVRVNGFDPSSGDWVVHGFYNGDTATLISLTQRSLLTDGLVQSNPFAAGGYLEYPTLLHAGLATLVAMGGFGLAWLHLLPAVTLLQVALTVPLFFLLWDVLFPEPHEAWKLWFGISSRTLVYFAQAGIVLYVMGLSWDGFVYPQGHFFLTGLYLFLFALLIRAWGERTPVDHLWVIPAAVTALVLLLANAVTGTAAVAAFVVFCALRFLDGTREIWQRGAFIGVGLGAIAAFLLATPGESGFGVPGFSYTGVVALLPLFPFIFWYGLSRVWGDDTVPPVVTVTAAVLIAMSLFTFFFSTRGIIVENAGRFIYHAALITFPLLLHPLIRLYYYVRRWLAFTTLSVLQRGARWLEVLVLVAIVLMPTLAGIASAFDHLLSQDTQRISADMQEGLRWVADTVPPDAVIAASPEAPWAVPQFTGRALLRADYWLSPRDDLLVATLAAWQGNEIAQTAVAENTDFLLLTRDEQLQWSLPAANKVFSNTTIAIFRGI